MDNSATRQAGVVSAPGANCGTDQNTDFVSTNNSKPRSPSHNRSRISPEKPWAKGNLTILKDSDVEEWLRKNAPEQAKEIKRETRLLEEAERQELTASGFVASNRKGGITIDSTAIFGGDAQMMGTPTCKLIEPPKHWGYALYPGSGSFEICCAVSPLLTDKENTALRMQFSEGRTGQEMSEALKVPASRVFGIIKQIRVKLYQALKENRLPRIEPPRHFTNTIDSLEELQAVMQQSPATYIYFPSRANRPKGQAYVCDCGHHLTLTNADLDHRRVVPGLEPSTKGTATRSKLIPERQFKCRFCKRTYPESQWHTILV